MQTFSSENRTQGQTEKSQQELEDKTGKQKIQELSCNLPLRA